MTAIASSFRALWFSDGRVAAPLDARVRHLRIASGAAIVLTIALWLRLTTGAWSPLSFAATAALVWTWLVWGDLIARWSSRVVAWQGGVASELLFGFLFCNSLLFALTLLSPLGMLPHLALLAIGAVVVALVGRGRRPVQGRTFDGEAGSLACIVFCGLAATLWVGDQQPLTTNADGQTVFKVWYDVFIHVREISAFAQAHGVQTLSDIKLDGIRAPVYHFAGYVMPAAFHALAGISAMDAYVAFQLPFGLLLIGVTAYTLTAGVLRTTWPAVCAAAAIVALPDAYEQGFGNHYLAFHFMSQVNLNMLYGIACISVAWLFMIEGCRRDRISGVVIAGGLLAVCLTYKAHLFVANALILMLYPCVFFGRSRQAIGAGWRVGVAIALVALFAVVVTISQWSPRVPTLRADGSGFGPYVDLLMGGFTDGSFKTLFIDLRDRPEVSAVTRWVLGAALLMVSSFGLWLVAGGALYFGARRPLDRRALWFVAWIVANYLGMALLLALDDRGIGAPEELVNRPQAWAYFVLVSFATAGLASRGLPRARWLLPVAALMLVWVHVASRNLQTLPEWPAYAAFTEFNTAPTCLVQAATYIRDRGTADQRIQDSRFDPTILVSAVAERQAFVSSLTFGGNTALGQQRIGEVRTMQSTFDARAMTAWAKAHRIGWYLMRPEDSVGWDPAFLQQAAFRCDGYRVFRFG